jgi:hypothetical protein
LQDPPNFTQIGIFGLKICRLATPLEGKSKKGNKAFREINVKEMKLLDKKSEVKWETGTHSKK